MLTEMVNGSRPDEIRAAEAAMHKAEANYEELRNGSRPEEIAASKSIYEATEADLARLKADKDRVEKLWTSHSGAVSAEQYDQAVAAFRMGSDRYAEAQKRDKLVKDGPRKEDIEQGKAAMEQAQAQYRLVHDGPRKEDIDQAARRSSRPRPFCRPPRSSWVTPL